MDWGQCFVHHPDEVDNEVNNFNTKRNKASIHASRLNKLGQYRIY